MQKNSYHIFIIFYIFLNTSIRNVMNGVLNNIKIYNSIYDLLCDNIFKNIIYSFQLYKNINKNRLNKAKPLSNF